jgi:hypothetical protein
VTQLHFGQQEAPEFIAPLKAAGVLGNAWASFLSGSTQDLGEYLVLLARIVRVTDDDTRPIQDRALARLTYAGSKPESQGAIDALLRFAMPRCRKGIATLQQGRKLEGTDLLELLQSRDDLTSLLTAMQMTAMEYGRLGQEPRFGQLRNSIEVSMRLIDGYYKAGLRIDPDEVRAVADALHTPQYAFLTTMAEHNLDAWWLQPLRQLQQQNLHNALRQHQARQFTEDQR